MEFKMKTETGKFETYYIDRNTGTPRKVIHGKNSSQTVCARPCR
jgi:hypothetical protein